LKLNVNLLKFVKSETSANGQRQISSCKMHVLVNCDLYLLLDDIKLQTIKNNSVQINTKVYF